MEFDDLLNSEAGPGVISKAMDILNRIRRLQGSKETVDAGPVVNNEAIKAQAYAASINKAGRAMRRCREPEAVPVHVTDARGWGDPTIGPTKQQTLAAYERAETYAQECRSRHRK